MIKFKSIRRDTIPCWYELSWRESQGIVLRIHKDFVAKSSPIAEDAPIVEHFTKEFGFTNFSSKLESDFGFNKSLKLSGETGEFIEFLIPMPLIKKRGGKCRMCKGSGKNDFMSNDCLHCEGEGVQISYDYTQAYAISASLSVLFEYLAFPEFETRSTMPQLIKVNTITKEGMHGGSLGGEYSREATAWMKKRGPGEVSEMIAAMQSAWKIMDGGKLKSYYDHCFRAWLGDNAWLCTDCPGNACGLHPSHSAEYDISKGDGFEFSCHNTDTPQQQLTLLASLAALHDLIRSGQ